MPLLITQSLLSSWLYQYKAKDPEAAEAEFMRVLRRERGEQSPAMLAGIEFETLCYRIANGEDVSAGVDGYAYDSEHFPERLEPIYPKGYDGACQVAKFITGAQFQVKAKRIVRVGRQDFLLYGILDALKAGTIYDIKYKSKSLGSLDLAGSYQDSPQHSAYFRIVPEAQEFKYLVSDGKDLYVETYKPEDTPAIENIIEEFVEYLKSTGLEATYKEHWKSKF